MKLHRAFETNCFQWNLISEKLYRFQIVNLTLRNFPSALLRQYWHRATAKACELPAAPREPSLSFFKYWRRRFSCFTWQRNKNGETASWRGSQIKYWSRHFERREKFTAQCQFNWSSFIASNKLIELTTTNWASFDVGKVSMLSKLICLSCATRNLMEEFKSLIKFCASFMTSSTGWMMQL